MTVKNQLVSIAIIIGVCLAGIASADDPAPQQPTAPGANSVPLQALPAPAPESAPKAGEPVPSAVPAESTVAPKPEDITIRLNAPVFSPRFAKIPLALINDEVITMEEFKKTLGTIHEGMSGEMSEGAKIPRKNFPELLKRLVNSLLIIQEARSMELDQLDGVKAPIDEFAKKLLREQLLKEQIKDVKASEKDVEKVFNARSSEWRMKSLIIDKLEDVKTLEAALASGKKYDELFDTLVKEGKAKEGGKSDLYMPKDAIPPAMLVTLEKMKPGEVSKAVALDKGYLIYRLEEKRVKEDPVVREQVRQELDAKARVVALEKFKDSLIKKYVTKKKLLGQLDFENKKVKFESWLKDKRVVAEVKGEKPVTVADLATAIAAKFYHGVERAVEGKKINKEKDAILTEHLGTIVFDKEARLRKIDQSDEYLSKLRSYSNSLLFGTFVNKVVRPEIVVTRDELLAYYNQHAKEYSTVAFYKLDVIAFDSPEKAEEAVTKLRQGMDFKWLKANAEGRVGIQKVFHGLFDGEPIAGPNLPEPIQKALAGSATGDFRMLVEGKTGYAINVAEMQPARTRTFAEVEDVVKDAVFYEKLNKGIDDWANKLKSSSEVIIYADLAQ